MDDQDPRLEGERATYRTPDTAVGRAASPSEPAWSVQAPDLPPPIAAKASGRPSVANVEVRDEDHDEPRLRQLQEEVAETRADIATTIGAIEDRLRPSALAASAKEAVAGKAASIGDSLAASQPARYARANPWGTVLMLTGAAVAVWLMVTPRRAPRRLRRHGPRRGAGHEFTRTHYDAGAEHSLESGATRVPGAAPSAAAGAHSHTYGGTRS